MAAEESMFRFLSVRPARNAVRAEPVSGRVPVYPPGDPTPFAKSVADLQAAGASKAEIDKLVGNFRLGAVYVHWPEGLDFDITQAITWLTLNGRKDLGDVNLKTALEGIYSSPLADVVAKPAFKTMVLRLADTLFAEALSPTAPIVDRDAMVVGRKLMAVMSRLAAGIAQPATGNVGSYIGGLILMLPRPARRKTAEPAPPAPPQPPKPTPDPGVLRGQRLSALEQTHRELSRLALDEKSVHLPKPTPRPVVKVARPVARTTARAAKASSASVAPAGTTTEQPPTAMVFTGQAIASLSDVSKQTLTSLKLDLSNIHTTAISGLLEEAMADTSRDVGTLLPTNSVIKLGGALINKQKLLTSLGIHDGTIAMQPPPLHRCGFAAGVGDLLLVKQTLKAYELGEFAHVENVMAGESRVRALRTLDLREQTDTTETDTDTEKERDLQSTERNETQAEAEQTVKDSLSLEAGLQISGSYGPSVSFTSNLGTSFSTSSEETQRKAVSYTREVSEKTTERVRQQVKNSTVLHVLSQVEETNTHSVENTQPGAKHVRGIYRWLNKVYDAQILNYGQRMMYEFVLPEPAAFLLYALITNPPVDNEIVKPDPPTYAGAPLRPSNLTRGNYTYWVAQYQVRNVPAPPPEFQNAAYFEKQDFTQDGSIFARANKIDIPAGYEAYAASVASDYSYTDGAPHAFSVMLGMASFDLSGFWGTTFKYLDRRYTELSVATHLFNAWSFTLGIDVYCRLTAEGLAKWQQQVYDAVMEAYLQQKADYDDARKQADIQNGVPIVGRNPLENIKMTRDELKKLALMALTGNVSIERDSMQATSEPLMNLDAICDNGSFIRFFENAFEWNNILYVLYPYFWGRHARWISAIHFTDPDPDFAAFLKAGAARVQVPVRPGFEKAMAFYCQRQQIWDGDDPPLHDDDLYVPIVDEITEALGKLDDGVPYPEGALPFEVRLPTSLVVVQNLEEIPHIRDVLTGADINLG